MNNQTLEIRHRFQFRFGIWALVAAALLFAFTVPAWALEVMPSTPDIAISQNATQEIKFGRPIHWIYLKNDCTKDLYIDLRGRPQAGLNAGNYPLRLKATEWFRAAISTFSITVSPAETGTACTLTVIPAR